MAHQGFEQLAQAGGVAVQVVRHGWRHFQLQVLAALGGQQRERLRHFAQQRPQRLGLGAQVHLSGFDQGQILDRQQVLVELVGAHAHHPRLVRRQLVGDGQQPVQRPTQLLRQPGQEAALCLVRQAGLLFTCREQAVALLQPPQAQHDAGGDAQHRQ